MISLAYKSKMRKFCIFSSFCLILYTLFPYSLDNSLGAMGFEATTFPPTLQLFSQKGYQHSPFTYPTSPIRSFNKLLRLHCSKYLVIFRFSIECYTFQYNLLSDYYTFQYNLQSKYYTFQYIFATKVLLFTHICKHYQDFLIFL